MNEPATRAEFSAVGLKLDRLPPEPLRPLTRAAAAPADDGFSRRYRAYR